MRNCGLTAIAGHQGNAPIEARGADGSWAAHGHTKQPGPTAGPGAQKICGSTSNNQRHTATLSVL